MKKLRNYLNELSPAFFFLVTPAVFLEATLMASPQIWQFILFWLCCGSPGTECFHSNKNCHLTVACIHASVILKFTLIHAVNV